MPRWSGGFRDARLLSRPVFNDYRLAPRAAIVGAGVLVVLIAIYATRSRVAPGVEAHLACAGRRWR